jgi:starvation-inducible DNA-binding protein
LQNYHWNIQGESFFRIHEKLEEYYDAVVKEIDEIAEHILINGAQPLGTLKDYLENTKIQEANDFLSKIPGFHIFFCKTS